METFEAISKRASLKACLSGRELERDKIEKVLEAGRLAPSARNRQPWCGVVVQGKENVEIVASQGFWEGNQMVREAPVLIIIYMNSREGAASDGKEFGLIDVGLAIENMLLAATDLGLATHPMAAVNEAELKKLLGVPDEWKFVLATPLAYPARGSYDEAAREKLAQRTRKSLQELFYLNQWAKPF